jgi:hypothetical protein
MRHLAHLLRRDGHLIVAPIHLAQGMCRWRWPDSRQMLLCLPETGIQREMDKEPMVMGLGSAKSSTECMFFIPQVSAFLYFCVLSCFVLRNVVQ